MSQRTSDRDPAGPPAPEAGLPAARGWASWVVFAGLLLILAGAAHAMEAVLAFTGRTTPDPLLLEDLTAWGVVHLLAAFALCLTGLGLLAGVPAARVCAVLLTLLSVLAAIAAGPATPARAVVVVLLGLVVVYAVTVHGDELRSPSY